MPAKIIFSDGSKALAHNNDDLYERWIERRRAQLEADTSIELNPFAHIEIFVPDLPEFQSLEQIAEYILVLNSKQEVLLRHKESQRPLRQNNHRLYRDLCSAFNAASLRIDRQRRKLGLRRRIITLNRLLGETKKPKAKIRFKQQIKEAERELSRVDFGQNR